MIGVLMALLVLNGLVLTGVGIWILVLASREGALQVILCLFVPFYGLYFMISRWSDLQPAAPIYFGSGALQILLFVGVIAMGASAVNDAVATANAQNAAAQAAAPTLQPEPSPAPEAPMPEPAAEPTPENPPEAAATPEPTPENPPPTATTNAETPPAEGTTQEPAKPDPNVPETKPEPKFPEGLQGQAQRAFHEGRTQDGNNYLRAALLTSDDKSLWDNVRWCPALERPVIGLRWGVALQLGEQPPVITPREGGGGPQLNRQGDGAAVQVEQPPAQEGENKAPADDELAELRKFTGDFGPKLLERLPKSTLDKLLGPLGEGVNGPKSVQFVGVGADAKAVTSLAQQKGVDEVLVANVSFKVLGVNRNVDATLTLRLIDVMTDKRLWASKSLSSNQAKIEISKGKDPTADVAKSLSDFLDKNFALKDKPDLDIVKLRQRAEVITKDQSNALAALVELRYYQLKGLLPQTQAEIYYRQILDLDSAPIISSGTPEQRRKALERFLPRT